MCSVKVVGPTTNNWYCITILRIIVKDVISNLCSGLQFFIGSAKSPITSLQLHANIQLMIQSGEGGGGSVQVKGGAIDQSISRKL